MRKMYVCSRPIKGANGESHRHLLGILSQDDNKAYRFEYTLGNEWDNSSLLLPFFPDATRIYGDHDVRLLLDEYLPSENDTPFINQIVKQTGLKKYDEWDWLCAFEPIDENSETILYETLPDDVIVHDNTVFDSANVFAKEMLDELNDDWDDIVASDSDDPDNESDNFDSNDDFDYDLDDDYEPEDYSDYYNYDSSDDATFDSDDMPFDETMPFDNVIEQSSNELIPDETNSEIDFDVNSITINEPIIEKPVATTQSVNSSVIIKKTTVVRKIKTSQNADEPVRTADDAVALVQKRLEQNIKERREKLKQTLNSNNSNNPL